ncbi:MAG: hypothetical protein WCY89_12055 [Flavobacteriaceae bacterium]
MKITTKLTAVVFSLSLLTTQVSGQEFYEDGSMKLTTISTNKKYGYEPNHKTSIKVGKVENEQAYLKALRGLNGEQVQFRRISSCCEFKSKSAVFGKGLLDKYEVYYEGLKEPIILYLNGYDYEEPKCPVGFTFVTADKIENPIIYPADSILKVNFCNSQTQFAVAKEFLLKEKIGELPEPDTNPTFEGGVEELKKYFADRPLTDERIKEAVFRVAIAFVVDCNGNAGNFMIVTKGKGLAETFANQVLERVNKMPQNWKPATKNGEKVDCYQVLSFTVTSGQLDKVTYR